jgi:hypothetical protein
LAFLTLTIPPPAPPPPPPQAPTTMLSLHSRLTACPTPSTSAPRGRSPVVALATPNRGAPAAASTTPAAARLSSAIARINAAPARTLAIAGESQEGGKLKAGWDEGTVALWATRGVLSCRRRPRAAAPPRLATPLLPFRRGRPRSALRSLTAWQPTPASARHTAGVAWESASPWLARPTTLSACKSRRGHTRSAAVFFSLSHVLSSAPQKYSRHRRGPAHGPGLGGRQLIGQVRRRR